jgi:hypothetical protein
MNIEVGAVAKHHSNQSIGNCHVDMLVLLVLAALSSHGSVGRNIETAEQSPGLLLTLLLTQTRSISTVPRRYVVSSLAGSLS